MHHLCPENSWCKYKIDPENYKHKNGLPKCVVKFIEPVFQDLSDDALLQKCLHGKTQNNNESLNKIIWDRCSKEYYVEKEVIEHSVYSAISYFNDGVISINKCFEKLGLSGQYTAQGCKKKGYFANSEICREVIRSSKKKKKDN